jgi:hypothetical protein
MLAFSKQLGGEMRALGKATAVAGALAATGLLVLALVDQPTIPAAIAAPGAPAQPAPQLGVPRDLPAQPDPPAPPDPPPEEIKPKPAAAVAPVPAKPKAPPQPAPAVIEIPPAPAQQPQLVAAPEIDAEQTVRNTIKQSVSAFEACYQNSLRRDSRIKGRVVVFVSVQSGGTVTSARLDESTIKDEGVVSCITARLKTLRFPPLGEDVDVTLPLALVPRE